MTTFYCHNLKHCKRRKLSANIKLHRTVFFFILHKETKCVCSLFLFFIPCQTQLMSPMQLTNNHISSTGPLSISSPMASQASRTGSGGSAYVHNYMSLFPGQVMPNDQAVVSSVSQPLSHDPLAQCLSGQGMASAAPMVHSPLDNTSALVETVTPSVITHTASSTVTPSDAATTFSHGSEYSSISTQPLPPPSQLQPMASLPASTVQHPQTFALPRPFQSPTTNKIRPMQRIAPANTLPSSHLILTGLFLISRSRCSFCILRSLHLKLLFLQ